MEDSIPSVVPVSGMKAPWTDDEDMILMRALVRGAEASPKGPFAFKLAVEDLKAQNGSIKSASSCRSRWHRVRIRLVGDPF